MSRHPEGSHEGHRKRLRARFLEEGLEHMPEHNALELLLFYVIPRSDTNRLARTLLQEFGSLKNTLLAPREALLRVPGVGEETAAFLQLIPAVYARCLENGFTENCVLASPEDVAKRLEPAFIGKTTERLVSVFMDGGGRLLRSDLLIDEGGLNAVQVNLDAIVSEAMSCCAVNVAIAHSHPRGMAAPSRADIEATVRLSEQLRLSGVNLCEHVIFAGDDRYYMSGCPRLPAGTLTFTALS